MKHSTTHAPTRKIVNARPPQPLPVLRAGSACTMPHGTCGKKKNGAGRPGAAGSGFGWAQRSTTAAAATTPTAAPGSAPAAAAESALHRRLELLELLLAQELLHGRRELLAGLLHHRADRLAVAVARLRASLALREHVVLHRHQRLLLLGRVELESRHRVGHVVPLPVEGAQRRDRLGRLLGRERRAQ